MRLALCTSFTGRAAWYFIEIGGEFDCLRLFQLECCNYMSVCHFLKPKNSGDEKLQVFKHYKQSPVLKLFPSSFLFGAEGLKAPSTPRKSQNIKQKQRKGRKHISETHIFKGQELIVMVTTSSFLLVTVILVTSCCSTSKGRRNEG